MKLVMMIMLLFFICTATTVAVSDHEARAIVVDTDGEAVTRNASYYILPSGGGGGLTSTSLSSCEFGIIQLQDENSRGDQLHFYPNYEDEDVVRLSTDQNIDFGMITICSSLVWRVGNIHVDDASRRFILGGGTRGRPGNGTIENWFKIERHEDRYKFSYCPSVCPTCNITCGDIGIIMEGDGLRRLALTKVPLAVKFKRVY